MQILVNCYFVRGQQERVAHEQKPVKYNSDGSLPDSLTISFDAAIHDDEVRRKFDPRADWDSWTSGADPFARKVVLTFVPAFGLTYLDAGLWERAVKLFPQLKVRRFPDAEVFYKGNLSDILNAPLSPHWHEGILGDTVMFPIKPKKPLQIKQL